MTVEQRIPLDRRFLKISDEFDPDALRLRSVFRQADDWSSLLAQHRYVVVLGEAGTGKTTEFRMQAERLKQAEYSAFYIRLDELAADGLDTCLMLEEQQRLTEWSRGDEEAYFFLDSVDEAKLRDQRPSRALRKLLHDLKAAAFPRARLILSCRVSDWQANQDRMELEEIIREGGKRENQGSSETKQTDSLVQPNNPLVHVVQLEPLDQRRIGLLASHHGVKDVDALLKAINDASAHMLAERPLDVLWLASYWNEKKKLTSLSELIEENIKRKLRERPERKATLPPDRAREGVEKLAGIATLAAKLSFLLPEEMSSSPLRMDAVDPQDVLSDWSNDDIRQLLTLAIFDEATYGRVRIHHRIVQEYLAACWLNTMLKGGQSRNKIINLVFRQSAGKRVVPPHLASTVAWLCLWDPGLCKEVCKVAPEILIDEGDPSALSDKQRCEILHAYATKYQDRDRLFQVFNRAGIRRFATSALTKIINELLAGQKTTSELRVTLLQIVEAGKLSACIPQSLQLALNPTESDRVRAAAIRAVGASGTDEQQRQLLDLLKQPGQWDQEVAANFIRALYPDRLSVSETVQLLERVTPWSRNPITILNSVLERELPERGSASQRLELIEGLLHSVCLEDGQEIEDAAHRGHLLLAIACLLSTILDEMPSGISFPAPVMQALALLSNCNPSRDAPSSAYKVRQSIERNTHFKRVLFWEDVSRTAKRGKWPTRYQKFEHSRQLYFYQLDKNDANWLEEDARNRKEVQERLLAFDALRTILEFWGGDQEVPQVLKELADQDEALGKRLKRFRNPPLSRCDHLQRFNLKRSKRRQIAQEGREERIHKETLAMLKSNINAIRSGYHIDLLWSLWREAMNYTSDPEKVSAVEVQLRERYGDEIADAAREGVKIIWHGYEPPFWYERKTPNSVPTELMLGLIGLTLSIQEGLDVTILPLDMRRKAIRYAACESSGFPVWLNTLAEKQPVVVREALEPCIRAHYQLLNASGAIGDTLRKMPLAGEAIRRACAPVLLKLLLSGDPPSYRVLDSVFMSILYTREIDLSSLDDIYNVRCKAADDPDRFAIWWCAWANQAGGRAIDFIEPFLASLDRNYASQLMESIGNRLQIWSEEPMTSLGFQLAIRTNVEALVRLIPLAYTYIDPANDIKHESGYSPNRRDNAQMLRNRLISWLSSVKGEATVWAFERLANDPRMKDFRDWLLQQAEQATLANDPCAPMSVRDAIHWSDPNLNWHAPTMTVSTPGGTPGSLPRIPNPVHEAHRNGKLAIFVGSGLSLGKDVGGNFPRWNEIALRLLDLCIEFDRGEPDHIEALRKTFGPSLRLEQMLSQLDTIKTLLAHDYQNALNRIFRPSGACCSVAHQQVVALKPPLIVTTNYDYLLEMADPSRTKYTWREADKVKGDLREQRPVLFKVHGTAEHQETVILTKGDYEKLAKEPGYQDVFKWLFQTYTFLFVGYGVNDPLDLDQLMKSSAAAFGPSTQRHFVLWYNPNGSAGRGPTEDRFEREYHISPIFYIDHDHLPAILKEIAAGATLP